MKAETIYLILTSSASVHVLLGFITGIFARYKSNFLSLMAINWIFGVALFLLSLISVNIADARPVILHPMALFVLSMACFLQSVYPLGVTMPGFLNFGRMFRYAAPAIALPIVYTALTYIHGESIDLGDINQLGENFYSWDVVVRIASVALSCYYILNIYLLPRKMARRSAEMPKYLLGYTSMLTLSMFFYMFATVFYSPLYIGLYAIIFTLLNAYIAFRSLEDIAIQLPLPKSVEVPEEPVADEPQSEELLEGTEEPDPEDADDFNEANAERFQRIQHWMQLHREEWTEATFGRDRLCEAVGLNRHLMLQTLRSQGFYNTHEYLMAYRVAELKRLIRRGEITKPSDACLAGFGTVVTARSCFQRVEGITLDAFLQQAQESR